MTDKIPSISEKLDTIIKLLKKIYKTQKNNNESDIFSDEFEEFIRRLNPYG